MATNYVRFQLDPTGTNVNNLIVNEQHNIGTKVNRIIAPNYGPFFTDNLLLKDNATGNQLVIGQDYYLSEQLQEAVVRFGKDIYLLIVITNENISTEISLTYQVLGGIYQKDAANLKNIYDSVTNNTSPVAWTNIVNKPSGFNPSLHIHTLEQLFGFEAFNIGLERITKAIQLAGLPAYEYLLEYINSNLKDINNKLIPVSAREVSDIIPNDKLVSFNRLLQAAKELNFNTITMQPNTQDFRSGAIKVINVNTTNMNDGTTLFWSIEHINTIDTDFVSVNGSVPIYNSKGTFNLQIPSLTMDSGTGVKIKTDINGDYYGTDTLYFDSSVGIDDQLFYLTDGNIVIDSTVIKTVNDVPYDEKITFTTKSVQLNTMFGFNVENGQPNDQFYYIIPGRSPSPMFTLDATGKFNSPINLFFTLDSGDNNKEIVFVFAGTLHRKTVKVKVINSGTNHPVLSLYPNIIKSGTKQSVTIIGGIPNQYYYIKPIIKNKKFRYFKINLHRTGIDGNIVATSGLMTIDSEDGTEMIDMYTKCCLADPDTDLASPAAYYLIRSSKRKIRSLDEIE